MTPTSTLSSSARRALRAAAHHLDPVVMMGQNGLTPAVLHEIDLALTAHALIKVRVQSDERETREAFLAEICQKLGCESVQHLGKLFVLWRNADGAADDDKDAEQDAAAVKAAHNPRGDTAGRGPRSKLASERAAGAAARAGAAAGPRGGAGAGSRTGAAAGSRSGAAAGSRSGAQAGERRRWGEAPPEPPRREGWAPKDRRGAARFGGAEGGDDSRRRDSGEGYGAPRGRAPGGTGGYGAPRGTGAAPAGRGGYGGGGQGSGQGYGERRSYGQDDGAPRARWGDRREPAQGSGGYGGGGGFGDDRSAPKQRSSYGRNSDAAGGRPPRAGGGGYAGSGSGAGGRGGSAGGSWGSRDGATGKPTGFSRGPASGARGGGGTGAGAGSAKPRARRRMG